MNDAVETRLPGRPEALLVHGGFLYTADDDDTIVPAGSLLIVDGQIEAVGSDAEVRKKASDLDQSGELERVDAAGMMILPGFVNAHWHENFMRQLRQPNGVQLPIDDRADGPTPFARGGDIRTLSVLLDSLFGLADGLEPEEAEAVASYSLWTQLRCGTTTFGDVGSNNRPEALVAATRRLGMRGAVSVWASDAACPPGDERYRRTRDSDDVLARISGLLSAVGDDPAGRVRVMPSVIYPLNMTDELGEGLAVLSDRYQTPFATHIAALRNESEVSRLYFGNTSIKRFSELGLLTDRLLAVHCAFFDDDDAKLLREAQVHINHSPAKYGITGESSMSETRAMIQLMRAGLQLSLSTDSIGFPTGGMPEAMRQAWLGHNEIWADNTTVPATLALAMASRIAAKGLRWAEVGSLEVGKCGDAVLVPIDDWRYFLRSRPLEGYLSLGGSIDVDTVIVDGRILVRSGKATLVDEEALRRDYLDALVSFERRSAVIDESALDAIVARWGGE